MDGKARSSSLSGLGGCHRHGMHVWTAAVCSKQERRGVIEVVDIRLRRRGYAAASDRQHGLLHCCIVSRPTERGHNCNTCVLTVHCMFLVEMRDVCRALQVWHERRPDLSEAT